MDYIIGMDDTDNLESRGTGHLARFIADTLSRDFDVHGVTRHQLLEDERVPMTAKNSCAAIHFSGQSFPLEEIVMFARKIILDDFQPGSDPGLCVVTTVPDEISEFGFRAKRQLLTQAQARDLAAHHNICLEGLGGTQDGVIGALAAVGLAADGNDGRYVLVGHVRELEGLMPITSVLAAGISRIQTLDGVPVAEGLIQAEKMRPSRRDGLSVLFVESNEDKWMPLKLD
jgi:tRNA(Ile2) C34 agmatinyltransferase TiaS